MNPARAARQFLRRQRHGVLSTLSEKLDGYPFGSIVPLVLDHAGRPTLLISRLAEHTRNIDADSRVSLLVHEESSDVQAAARLTLVGDAAQASSDLPALEARYLRYVPQAGRLLQMGDFSFYRIEPVALRFVGGFGDMQWISAASYVPLANTMAEREADILTHMNADHPAMLRDCARHFSGIEAATIAMTGVDCDGFDVRADGALLRFKFTNPVVNAHEVRAALIAMARETRP